MFGFFKKKPPEQPNQEAEAICDGYVITVTVKLSKNLPQSIVERLRAGRLEAMMDLSGKPQRIDDPRVCEEGVRLTADNHYKSHLTKA